MTYKGVGSFPVWVYVAMGAIFPVAELIIVEGLPSPFLTRSVFIIFERPYIAALVTLSVGMVGQHPIEKESACN